MGTLCAADFQDINVGINQELMWAQGAQVRISSGDAAYAPSLTQTSMAALVSPLT